jgi:hypothetical protein
MTATDLVIVPPEGNDTIRLGVIHANRPAELVQRASEAADQLAAIIKAKGLFSNIQGKEYVKVEGWTTLAAMMGCLPKEVSMVRREDGAFEATVELVRMLDGLTLTRASAECGKDEPTWKGRPDYARRSMAATRATSKVCRLAFSWVMVLAGFSPTPAEEIPHDEDGVVTRRDRKTAGGAKDPTHSGAPVITPEPTWQLASGRVVPIDGLTTGDLQAARKWAFKRNSKGEYTQKIEQLDAEIKKRSVSIPSNKEGL